MVKTLCFLALISLCSTFYAQSDISGRIISSEGKSIPFATISIIGKQIGTFTNEDGLFHLTFKTNPNDSIQFSCIGFQSIKLPLSTFTENQTVKLNKTSYQVDVVTVTNTKRPLTEVMDNQRVNCRLRSRAGTQFVSFIELPKGSILNDITFYCKRSQYRPIVGLQVYNINDKKEPGESLLKENYTIAISKWHTKIHFDLKKYNITCQKNGLYVGISFMGESSQDPKQQRQVNPFVYFSSKNQKSVTYSKVYHLPFQQQNFPCLNNRVVNLQCSYSYYE